MVTPLADHGCSLDCAKSGHFTCSRERTDHVLPTHARGARVDRGVNWYYGPQHVRATYRANADQAYRASRTSGSAVPSRERIRLDREATWGALRDAWRS